MEIVRADFARNWRLPFGTRNRMPKGVPIHARVVAGLPRHPRSVLPRPVVVIAAKCTASLREFVLYLDVLANTDARFRLRSVIIHLAPAFSAFPQFPNHARPSVAFSGSRTRSAAQTARRVEQTWLAGGASEAASSSALRIEGEEKRNGCASTARCQKPSMNCGTLRR